MQRQLVGERPGRGAHAASTVRSIADSCTTARSAVSPSSRHHSAIAFSVLNRKCGSRCERSASSWARSASRRERGRRAPRRAPGGSPARCRAPGRSRRPGTAPGRRPRSAGAVSNVRPIPSTRGHDEPERQHHAGADGAVEQQADAAVARGPAVGEQHAPRHRRHDDERRRTSATPSGTASGSSL